MGIFIMVTAFVAFISGYFASHILRPTLGKAKKEALPPVNIEIPVEGDFEFVELEPLAPAPSFVKTSEIPIFMGVSEKSRLEQQLRSALFNGCLWEAVETFKTLKELGEDPSLLEYTSVLQDFPEWDWKKKTAVESLEEFVPIGTESEIKREAARLFLRMAVFHYRRKKLLLTAAFVEAAYNALHTEIKLGAFAKLGKNIDKKFTKGSAAGTLDTCWPYNR